ncbi:MAG: hypothetical protein M3P51_13845, partial [Chloroflexota bacterium]|nr:hypothetical protein [Chloroflexota bacterium]
MQVRVFTGRGEAVKDVVDSPLGSLEWAFREGATTLTVPMAGLDYRTNPSLWSPRGILHKLLYVEMINGLPNWGGVIRSYSDDTRSIALGVPGCQAALKRQVIRRPFDMDGEPPAQVLARGFGQAMPDGYPLELAEIEESGRSLKGWVPYQSLYTFTDNLAERLGWEWTSYPRLVGNRLTIETDVAPRIGRHLGRSAGMHDRVEILGDGLQRLIQAQFVVNEILAVGKGARNQTTPMQRAQLTEEIKRPDGVRLSAVMPCPEITDRGALRRAAEAAVRWRGVLP